MNPRSIQRKVFFLLTASAVLTLCGAFLWRAARQPVAGLSIVTVRGDKKSFNISRNWVSLGILGSGVKPGKIIARDGDLLWFTTKGDEDVFLQHISSEGLEIDLVISDSRDGLVYRNGKPVAAHLSVKHEEAWETLSKGNPALFRRLEVLYIPESVSEDGLKTLAKIGKSNPRIGIVVSPKDGLEKFSGYFTPSWCFFGASSEESPATVPVRWRGGLEMAVIGLEGQKDIRYFAAIPKLSELHLSSYDPEIQGLLPAMPRLRKLLIADSPITDLGFLKNIENLEELVLAGCGSLVDISALAGYPELRTLVISGDPKIRDFSALTSLRRLEYLALPAGISAAECERIFSEHPDLRFLEFSSMTDAAILRSVSRLKRLEGLVFLKLSTDPEVLSVMFSLKSLTQLRLLVLPEDLYKASSGESFTTELGEVLRGCDIVAGSGICLGSGWLLLLPGFVLLFAVFNELRKRSVPLPVGSVKPDA